MDTGSFDKLLNRIIDKKYKIESAVGVGGMAYVLKAKDMTDGKIVAIKFLSDEFKNDERAVKRFINESKTISMLNHENIVKVYDVVITPERKYIVMEFIDGITLKDYIDKIGTLGWKEAIHYIKQVLSALDHAHEKLVIHRDIKPQNIMLLPDGTVKVTDFGIAKQPGAESITMTDKAIGTVNYISPEQASGAAVDTRTDIYSVGVMLYEMVTGRLPFIADSPVAVAMMQVSNEPLSPREINPQIPIGLEQIILKAMQKNADERFSGAAAMLKAINYFAKNPDIVFAGSVTDTGATGAKLKKSDYIDEKKKEEKLKKKRRGSRSMFPIVSGIAVAAVVVLVVATSSIWWPIMSSLFGVEPENRFDEALNVGSDTLNHILGAESGREVEVPSFIGRVYNDELIAEIEELGYIVEKEEVDAPKNKNAAPNTVIDQYPEAGLNVKHNTITLKVNKSNESMFMPNCIRMNEAAAKAMILDSINSISDTEYSSDYITVKYYTHPSYPKGYVISTIPDANSPAISKEKLGETEFIINVSMGKEIENTTVPNLEDKTMEEARSALISRGISVRNIINEPNPTVDKGVVIKACLIGTNTELSGGEQVAKGIASVDLWVSIGNGSETVDEEEQQPETEEETDGETDASEIMNAFGNDSSSDTVPPPPASEQPYTDPSTLPSTIISPASGIGSFVIPDNSDNNSGSNNSENSASQETSDTTVMPPPPASESGSGIYIPIPGLANSGNTDADTSSGRESSDMSTLLDMRG